MNQNCELSNTSKYFPTDYLFDIYSLTWEYKPLQKEYYSYILTVDNLATNSIKSKLNDIISNSKNSCLEILERTDKYIWYTDEREYSYNLVHLWLKKVLTRLARNSHNQNKTTIIWFSSLWWYDLLEDLKPIIKELKIRYPYIIFVIWWADYNELSDQKFLQTTLAWWFDMINIWWAEEFIEFITSIWKDDKFYRDSRWNLKIETKKQTPQNLLISGQLWDTNNIIPGKKIETTYDYDPLEEQFHFLIKNSECLNSCWYCANYLHSSRTPLRNEDINESIINFNNYLNEIEIWKELSIMINNPNPFQYIDKFFDFLKWINLNEAKNLVFFGDFTGLSNTKKYDKLIIIIDYLIEKYPNLITRIGFSFDAINREWDWDYIHRTNWNKISTQKDLTNWFNNYIKLIKKYKYEKNIDMPYNTIIHPNLSLQQLKQRFTIANDLDKLWLKEPHLYNLEPSINTKISEDYKWYYITQYDTVKNKSWKKLFNRNMWNLVYWWHFYKNSCLLDYFELSRDLWLVNNFSDLVKNNTEYLQNEMDNNKISLLLMLFQWWLDRIKYHPNEKENNIDKWILYMNYIIYREKYIYKSNPNYCSKKEYTELIWYIKSMKIEYENFDI